jgi:hypothetical protein
MNSPAARRRRFLGPALGALALTVAGDVRALSFLSFDARSMAMGGTGVVTARAHNASLFNPALLTDADPDSGQRRYPRMHAYAGARVIDRDDFLDAARHFRHKYGKDSLNTLLDASVNLAPSRFESGAGLRQATAAIRRLQDDINRLSKKPLQASASYGLAFGYPRDDWALGGYYRSFLVMGSAVRIAGEDMAGIDRVTATLDAMADLIDELRALDEEIESEGLTLAQAVERSDDAMQAVQALNVHLNFDRLRQDVLDDNYRDKNLQDYMREPLPEAFLSRIDTRGAAVTEQALSAARRFDAGPGGSIHLGMNIKQVDFTTISFNQPVADFDLDAHEFDEHRRKHRRLNVDLGFVYDLPGPWVGGLVTRNLMPYSFATTDGETVRTRPIARLGIGHVTDRLRLCLDLDLTRNEPLGYDPDKRFLSFGVEKFLWRNTALRAGLRTNLVDGETLPSVGLGIGGNKAHLDIGLARGFNVEEWGLGIQAGLAFD